MVDPFFAIIAIGFVITLVLGIIADSRLWKARRAIGIWVACKSRRWLRLRERTTRSPP